MSASGRFAVTIAAAAAVLLWAPRVAAAPAEAAPRKGDHVLFSGQVSDAAGQPVANVTVLLELSHSTFSLRRFKQVKKNTLRIPVTATVDGRYLHDWRWDGYYNTFELAVALRPDPTAGRDDFEILHRVDVTERVRQGAAPEGGEPDVAVVTPLVLDKIGDLGWLRRLLAGTAGADEIRVLREMGAPGRADAYPDGASAWWYFEAGKVYRFRGGALEQVEPFEPIKRL